VGICDSDRGHMTVEYDITVADYREANRAHVRRQFLNRRTIAWIVIAIAAWMFLASLAPRREPRPRTTQRQDLMQEIVKPLLPWLAFFATALGIVVWRIRNQPKRAYAGQPELQRHHRLDVDDQKLVIDTGEKRTEMTWGAIQRTIETPGLFLLYTSEYALLILPKRAFAGSDEDEFRQLLQRRVGRGEGLAP
jgi:hypothetical protein